DHATSVDDDITGPIRGYHEVLALGYDASGVLIENSWGTTFGDNGFARLSWRVIENDVAGAYTIDGFAARTPVVRSLSVGAGPVSGRTKVVLRGGGFNGATQVHFGTTRVARFRVVSDTTISAISPAHRAGVVHVTVTAAAGTSP